VVQFKRLQELQHLQDGEALRRRWCLVDRDTAIDTSDGLRPFRPLIFQILSVEESAVRLREACELVADIALIECFRAVARHRFERARKVGIAQDGPRFRWRAVGEENRGRFRAAP
jgi:hypothetical protein